MHNSVWQFKDPDVVILDNRDSFVFNLAHRLYEVGMKSIVLRSDKTTIEDLIRYQPKALVISPGPGHPRDAGCSVEAICYFDGKIPILGVCLGHQAIAHAFGIEVIRSEKPRHGKVSTLTISDDPLFKNITNFEVGRYHSLIVEKNISPKFLEIATSDDDNFVMAIRKKKTLTWGLQFHPESVLTQDGIEMLRNFSDIARLKYDLSNKDE